MSDKHYIELEGGVTVSAQEAKEALDEARDIIAVFGTTDVDSAAAFHRAKVWLKRYYPNSAD